jgi:Tol biopolymer transport system component
VQDAIFYPELSPDERRVAVSARDEGRTGGRGIFIHDLATGAKRRLTESSGNDNLPVWSPDGRRIGFTSSRSGNYDLYVKSIDPDEPEALLLASDRREFTNHWSPDGRHLSFTRDGGASAPAREILMLPLAPGPNAPAPFLHHADAWFDGGEFSPDGRHLAYASNLRGQFEVHVALVADSLRTEVVSRALSFGWAGGGGQPRWRGDGRELFYMIGDTMMSVEVDSADPLTFKTPARLFALPGMRGHFPDEMPWLQKYDVTADGQRFLFVRTVIS